MLNIFFDQFRQCLIWIRSRLLPHRQPQYPDQRLQQIVELNRFVNLGRLSSGLLHDIANPLTILAITIDELWDITQSPHNMHHTQILLTQASRAIYKLEQLVEATRRQIQNQETTTAFSIEAEIRQTIELLAAKARNAGVKLIFEPETNSVTTGNPVKFFQIMLNLISNGIDAYQDMTTDDQTVIISTEKRAEGVQITVIDQGIGIQPYHLHQIFEPFFSTKSIDHGTGIGLALTKTMVTEDFNGQIEVNSRPNQGSTFVVTLPLQPVPANDPARRGLATAISHGRSYPPESQSPRAESSGLESGWPAEL